MGGVPEQIRNESEEAYAARKWKHHQEQQAAIGKAQAFFVKRRFGPPGVVGLGFDGPSMVFSTA